MQHRYKLFCATLLSALCLSGQAATGKTPVVDQVGLNGFQEYLDKTLPLPLATAIAQRGLTVWGRSDSFRLGKKGYCVALVGITTASSDKRLPRMPSQIASYLRAENLPQGEWNEAGCRALTVSGAIEVLATTKLETLDDMQDTLPTGGSRSNPKANPELVSLRSINTEARTVDAVLDAINDYSLGAAVDYRHVMTTLYNTTFKLDGQLICLAYTGLSARAPDGRQPRLPAMMTSSIYVGDHTDDAGSCQRGAALNAIKSHFNQPWTSTGIFKDFEKSREDGIALPNVREVAKKRASALARAAAPRASVRTTQRDVVRCSNVCTNGNCVRTFENGRKERWQAPRVYDPFKNDWTWDTNSCGK